MKSEKPVKVIPRKGKHKTETRVFARNIHESYCVQEGCPFKGQPSVQGVCHTTETFSGSPDWSYVELAEKTAESMLADLKKRRRKMGPKEYVANLESCYVVGWMQQITLMDELIYLRRKVALLELKTKKK